MSMYALLCGCAGFTTTPLDVLKTRLMTQGSGADRLYANVWDCAVKIYKEEAVGAFLRGWEPRVTWIAIGGCIFFTALEQSKKLLVPVDPTEAMAAIAH
jgi:solute carrier family 25 (mitochondrial S-adenosylmethionine transporter), member 26